MEIDSKEHQSVQERLKRTLLESGLVKDDLSQTRQKLTEFKVSYEEMEKNNTRLVETLENLKKEHSDAILELQAKFQSSSEKVAECEKTRVQLQAVVDGLNQDIKRLANECDQVETQRSLVDTLNQKNDALNQQIEKLVNDCDELKTQRGTVEGKYSELEKRLGGIYEVSDHDPLL